jgi:hypothetical protein
MLEEINEIKNYSKRVKKIIGVENEYREGMLEYLYSICYPNIKSL